MITGSLALVKDVVQRCLRWTGLVQKTSIDFCIPLIIQVQRSPTARTPRPKGGRNPATNTSPPCAPQQEGSVTTDQPSAAEAAHATDLQQLPEVTAQQRQKQLQHMPADATPQLAKSAEWVVAGNASALQYLGLPQQVAQLLGIAEPQDCQLGLADHEDVQSRITIDQAGSIRIRHNWVCVRDAIGLQGGDTLSVQYTTAAGATPRLQLTKVSI